MPAKRPLPETARLVLDTKSNMHAVVRRVPAGPATGARAIGLEQMNAVLMARDADDFVRAVDGAGLMYAPGDVPAARKMGAAGLRSALGSRLASPDAGLLLSECYFDPFSKAGDNEWEFEGVGRVAKAATSRAAAELALSAGDPFIDEGSEYVVEPLHDWVILRNLMSIAMRILANARAAAEEGRMGDVLAQTGFSLVKPASKAAKNAMGHESYVIPVGYNPFFSRPAVDLSWKDENIWPFYCSITEDGKTWLEKAAGVNRPRRLRGAEDVVFLTSVQAGRAEESLSLRRHRSEPDVTWLYMAIAADEGQEAAANAFLRGMQGLFGTEVVSCGGPKSSEVVSAAAPTNLPEAMWADVRDHENLYIMSCRFCGRTVFANMHGGETSFCSPSCRSAYSQMLRKAGAE